MPQFELFRIRVSSDPAEPLFGAKLRPREALRVAVESKPSMKVGDETAWHVGNVEWLDQEGVACAIGRTSKATREVFDEMSGNFVAADSEESPFTLILIDLKLEVCAIAKKTALSPRVSGIARRLEGLLNSSREARRMAAHFEVASIDDPEDFITRLKEAYAVISFKTNFGLPNPIDANELFQKPLEKMLSRSGGKEGSATFKGDDLDADVLAEVARSTAATGKDAVARLKESKNSKPVRRSMKGNVATLSEDATGTKQEKLSLMQKVRELYRKVRGSR
jgi:hypothetical protein